MGCIGMAERKKKEQLQQVSNKKAYRTLVHRALVMTAHHQVRLRDLWNMLPAFFHGQSGNKSRLFVLLLSIFC